MMTGSKTPSLWQVIEVEDPELVKFGVGTKVELLSSCEWLRLLVSQSLAFAQRNPASGRFEYLVLGSRDLDHEDRNSIAALVADDFNVLLRQKKRYERLLTQANPKDGTKTIIDRSDPIRLFKALVLLAELRLPESIDDWKVSDEGLAIVRWGLKSGKPFFEWSEQDFHRKRDEVLKRYGLDRAISDGSNPDRVQAAAVVADMATERIASDTKESPRRPKATAGDRGGQRSKLFSGSDSQKPPATHRKQFWESEIFVNVTGVIMGIAIGVFAMLIIDIYRADPKKAPGLVSPRAQPETDVLRLPPSSARDAQLNQGSDANRTPREGSSADDREDNRRIAEEIKKTPPASDKPATPASKEESSDSPSASEKPTTPASKEESSDSPSASEKPTTPASKEESSDSPSASDEPTTPASKEESSDSPPASDKPTTPASKEESSDSPSASDKPLDPKEDPASPPEAASRVATDSDAHFVASLEWIPAPEWNGPGMARADSLHGDSFERHVIAVRSVWRASVIATEAGWLDESGRGQARHRDDPGVGEWRYRRFFNAAK
ncbi:hypothetical protein OAR33_00195 [bacterium]|nr:hypothetical protein [bacterium]